MKKTKKNTLIKGAKKGIKLSSIRMIKRSMINDDDRRMLAKIKNYTAKSKWRRISLIIFTLQTTSSKKVSMSLLTDNQSNHSQSANQFIKVFRTIFASACKRRTKVAVNR